MIDYPYLQEQPSSRQMVDVFKGYNRNLRIADGEFSEMSNMTSDHYPVLSPRGKRTIAGQTTSVQGMHYVSGVGTFRIDNGKLWFTDDQGMVDIGWSGEDVFTSGNKQFALMGKHLIIAPDMKWLEVSPAMEGQIPVYDMGETWDVTSGTITISLCRADGQIYAGATASPTPPENPGNLALWIDSSVYPNSLKQYNALTAEWISIPTVYLKLSGLGDHYFEKGDGVTISGLGDGNNMQVTQLNGSYVIEHQGRGEIVITGILNETWTQDCGAYPIRIERKVPRLDFVVESGNRLWGCKKNVNEIYASKLGDFKNWNVFSGLSTDSWVGNVGSPGHFTGAVNHGGYPVFYKQDTKHKIWPSSTGAHQITSTTCPGVRENSSYSLARYHGQLIYQSPEGICMDDGSGPVLIDGQLGNEPYYNGTAAAHGHKYYICMMDSAGKWNLLTYDLRRQLWHREDNVAFGFLVSAGHHLFAAETGSHGSVWDLTGGVGTAEETVHWRVRTGDLMLASPDRKYISRLTLRLSLEPGSKLEIYARYDHEDLWVRLGTAYGRRLGSFSLPVRPRRCDQLQLELRGEGMGKVYSITKTLEEGSELP